MLNGEPDRHPIEDALERCVGRVTGGTASFGTGGMEAWHPSPASFFVAGGGPLLDVGPYYVTQLVNLLGPVSEVMEAVEKRLLATVTRA